MSNSYTNDETYDPLKAPRHNSVDSTESSETLVHRPSFLDSKTKDLSQAKTFLEIMLKNNQTPENAEILKKEFNIVPGSKLFDTLKTITLQHKTRVALNEMSPQQNNQDEKTDLEKFEIKFNTFAEDLVSNKKIAKELFEVIKCVAAKAPKVTNGTLHINHFDNLKQHLQLGDLDENLKKIINNERGESLIPPQDIVNLVNAYIKMGDQKPEDFNGFVDRLETGKKNVILGFIEKIVNKLFFPDAVKKEKASKYVKEYINSKTIDTTQQKF
jgi:hypothetical protein